MGTDNLERQAPETEGETTEHTVSQPGTSGQGVKPAKLANSTISAELMVPRNKGGLAKNTFPELVRQFRRAMIEQESDAGERLRTLVIIENWDEDYLSRLLCNPNITDSTSEARISILRAACPNYLPILLRNSPKGIIPSLLKDLFERRDDAGITAIEEMLSNNNFATLESVFDCIKNRAPDFKLQRDAFESVFKGQGVAPLAAFAKIKWVDAQHKFSYFHEIAGIKNLMALTDDERLQVIEPLLSTSAFSDGMLLFNIYMEQAKYPQAFCASVLALQRKHFTNGFDSTEGRAFMQQFLQDRTFNTDPLAKVFLQCCTPEELLRATNLLEKKGSQPANNFEAFFENDTFSRLQVFAETLIKVKGLLPPYHVLVGESTLWTLNTADVLVLIKTLLSNGARSHGIALLDWYKTEKTLDADFYDSVCAKQRKLLEGFDTEAGLEFMVALLGARTIPLCPVAKAFLRNCTQPELSALVKHCFITDNLQLVYAIMRQRRDDFQYLLENVSHGLLNQTSKTQDSWALACISAIPQQSNTVVQYYRNHFKGLTENSGFEFLRKLLDGFKTFTEFPSLWSALQPQEIHAVIQHKPRAYLEVIPAGQLPFACIKNRLYTSGYQLTRQEGDLKYSGVDSNGSCVNGMLKLKFSTTFPSRFWGDDERMQKLVSGLLEYRKERLGIQQNRFLFLGLFEVGYTKQQKLNVVDKMLIHIYGTEAEKEAAGAITWDDRSILNNGNLSKVINYYERSFEHVVAASRKYVAASAPLAPTPSSS